MIRKYNENDIDVIIKLYNLYSELTLNEEKDKREELKNDTTLYVYEEKSIKGFFILSFWKSAELGSCAEIIMSIDDDDNFIKIANALWDKAIEYFKENKVEYLITNYNDKFFYWNEFYISKDFEDWFGIHGMKYNGENINDSMLTYRNYKEDDFDLYYKNLGECFSEMRKANDIIPYDLYKSSNLERIERLKKETNEAKDTIYMFYDNDNFVGSSIVNNNEIDDLFVVPAYQGMGYGRKVLNSTLNICKDKFFNEITIGVVVWNKPAYNLYKSAGFKTYRTYNYKRLKYNWR